ncbi:PilN domain-containing protein [Desulfitobacterium sp.]|uniref:PilN domain-containing protein n=1 Tax=Desulfitobacterium sp. TaxID=49981 RepID=UPI002CC183DB|nr:PilN domain-containing protein [Desulfitobacterium sp.]HVJ48877.1 PilN domain-containing protein [Desulfitobacterium sp.]
MRENKDFNFALRWEQIQALQSGVHQARRKRRIILRIGGGVLGLALLGSLPWIWSYKIQYGLNAMNQKISALSEVDQQVKKVDDLKVQMQNQQQMINLVQQNTVDPGPLLEKLKDLLPAGTTISSFSLQPDKSVKMTLSVPTPVDVARFWLSFQNSGLFEKVDIKTVSLEDKIQKMSLDLKLK